MRKNCPNTEFFWPVFFHIWDEHGDLRSKSPYSVQIRKNTDQKNPVFGHFSRSMIYMPESMPATLLKRNSSTGVFLRNLRNF